MTYDAQRIAAFFDAYGEQEWTRFEDGRTPSTSLEVHSEYLRRFVRAGDRVLDVGAGPGRFTLELARLGAEVVVADLSPEQLELNKRRLVDAGLEDRVVERVLADVTELCGFESGAFDAVVCFGGPVSYAHERSETAISELVRVTRREGHVLLSVMSLSARSPAISTSCSTWYDATDRRFSSRPCATGSCPRATTTATWRCGCSAGASSKQLLSAHGTVVAASAAGLLAAEPPEPELRELLARVELDLAAEPGAISCGEHILAVLRKDR